MAYDENGDWYDDQSTFGYEDPALYSNQFMQTQMPGQNFSNSKWNFGAPQAVGQNVYNQFLTGTKNLGQLQTNPSLLYNAMVATGQPTMDMNGLMGLDSSGLPFMGGGGGGGGGGGNGYNPNFVTSNLDNLANSPAGTPGNLIYSGIKAKKSPIDIKLDLRADGQYDTDTLKALDQQVDDAFGEYAGASRNEMAGLNQPAQQTPIQEWLSKNGLINPMEQYNADTLPADIDTSAAQGAALRYLALGNDARDAGRANTLRADDLGAQLGAERSRQSGLDAGTVKRALGGYTPPVAGSPGGGTSWNTLRPEEGGSRAPGAGPRQGTSAVAGSGVPRAGAQALARMAAGFLGVGGNKTAPQRRLSQQQTAASNDAKRDVAYQQHYKDRATQSEANIRTLIARDVAKQGRTPARDAQRVLLNYMRQGGMQG